MTSASIETPPARATVAGDEVAVRSTSDQSDGALLALEVRIPPGGGPPILHRHAAVELYRVERGELAIYIEENGVVARRIAGPGATVAIEGGREHTIRNESAVDACAFVVFSPGRDMERFVREAARLSREGRREMDDVLALATANGIEVTRPLEGAA
jgi:mannose-6-phosphate isomerase-like protein (cupin superfamily)